MPQPKTCILGGTGFIGRNLIPRLLAKGHHVVVPTRQRERNRDLLVYPSVNVVQADIFDRDVLAEQFHRVDTVINLVGILNQSRRENQNFEQAHVALTKSVIETMQAQGVPRLLHMSASNADPAGPSQYLETKGQAEDLVHGQATKLGYTVTSFRPSVVFGPGDSFTNRFASLLTKIPLAFPLACPQSLLQPVFVEDVAKCFVDSVDDPRTFGQQYSLCGPDVLSLLQIVRFLADTLGIKRRIVPLSDRQSKLQASLLQWFPGKPFTPDNYNSLQVPSVCDGPFPEVFGIRPRALSDIVPGYLVQQPSKLDGFRKIVPGN